MSMAAAESARQFAASHTQEEIAAEVARLEAMPEWRGCEFDDARVRHKHQTRIATLKTYL